MPFGCFAFRALCGTTGRELDITRAGPSSFGISGLGSKAPRGRTPDEEFFLTFGWPAGLPFQVHQHQIEHVRSSAVELYDVALRELGGALDWRAEIGFSLDAIKSYIQKVRRFTEEWATLSRMESYLRENEIKGDVTDHHTQLYFMARDFQELIDLGAWNARYERARTLDLAALDITLGIICRTAEDLDRLKQEDKAVVQRFMQHLQRKIHATPRALTEPYLEAMLGIHRRTRLLPPLTDLAHEITRRDTFPFVRGGQSDIWRGMWLGLPVALKLVRHVGRRSGATVRRMSVSSTRRNTEERDREGDEGDNGTLCPGGDAARAFQREARIWRQLMHEHVHAFLGVWVDRGDVYLVSPFMDRGDAAGWVRNQDGMGRLKLMLEISQGLEYLHLRTPAVIHGDLRLANVLIADNGSACITDFGLARVLEGLTLTPVSQQLGVAGATRWMARELLLPTPPPLPTSTYTDTLTDGPEGEDEPEEHVTVTRETDMWSWGMTALEAMTAQPPYAHRRRDTQVMLDIIGGVLPARPREGLLGRSAVGMDQAIADAVWGLMERCWRAEPAERPSASEVVAEMWRLQRRL
ncbi:Tyrosine kinase catalytic domain protein [Ceratobasidium sp. AG-Ba]|nr:Tyrosine kinase catalytic domain protein [Ceratobasidium sp. AG-Ba]